MTATFSEVSLSEEVTVTVILPLSAPASLSSGIVTETKNWPVLTAPTVTSEALAVGVQTAGPSTLIPYAVSYTHLTLPTKA